MHKCLFNEAYIRLVLRPQGPLLIKAGEGGSDPTQPDMSFVRTYHSGRETVYLPGSSLKGVIRAHAERLARTVRSGLACDPLDRSSCGDRLDRPVRTAATQPRETNEERTRRIYRESCFLCRMFGNTSLSSRFRVSDAYPLDSEQIRREERNGVAIDRIYGSVAVGPFNYEAVTTGEFELTISVRNWTLAQLGLFCLCLRDLEAGHIRVGFGKSRGLGAVAAEIQGLVLRYPNGELAEGERLQLLGRAQPLDPGKVYGVGALAEEPAGYGLSREDAAVLPPEIRPEVDPLNGVELKAPLEGGKARWHDLARVLVAAWKQAALEAPHRG